jgi:soluble lytic murein transglycosylase-like protein
MRGELHSERDAARSDACAVARVPEPGRPQGQSRRGLHLLLVIAVALAFLLDSGAPRPGGSSTARLAEFDSAAIATYLQEWNPSLSDAELRRIGSAVVRSSQRHGLDPRLVTAVLLVESGARPWVHSPKGAIGLMQVMPHMMLPLDLAGNASTIESNVEAGCTILAHNIRRLGEEDGISAYFWGSDIRGVAYLRRVQAAHAELSAAHPS